MDDGPKRILLVEDDPDDVVLIREALTESKVIQFRVTLAEQLSGALELLHGSRFDLIVLDLSLPDSRGLDTLLSILRQNPALPIVVLTSLDDEEVGVLAVQNGAQDYLVKGQVNDQLLVRSIRFAIERHQAEVALERHRQRLERLSRRLIEVQEEERRRIAHELHDEIGQVLTAVKINLQALQDASEAPGSGSALEESIGIVDRALQQVRDLSLDLRPSLLDNAGLIPALRWYVYEQTRRTGVAVDLKIEPMEERLSPSVEIVCFRIVQEALTNVIRHARASHAQVELGLRSGELHLIVRDNGAGFDVPAMLVRASEGGSLGLLGMQERVQLAGGRIDIESRPGYGTEIRARFSSDTMPLSEDDR